MAEKRPGQLLVVFERQWCFSATLETVAAEPISASVSNHAGVAHICDEHEKCEKVAGHRDRFARRPFLFRIFAFSRRAFGSVADAGNPIEDSGADRHWQNKARLCQGSNPDYSCREIRDPQLTNEGQRTIAIAALDAEYLVGRELRPEQLGQAREQQPHARAPEHEPFSGEQHERHRPVEEEMFRPDRADRRHHHQ